MQSSSNADLLNSYFTPDRGTKDCNQCICISVCLSRMSEKPTHPNVMKFSVVVTCVLGPPLTAMWYVMYFRFCGCRLTCFHITDQMGQNQIWCVYFVQFARWRHQSDVRQCCLIMFTRWRYRGRSLPPATAPCLCLAVLATQCKLL